LPASELAARAGASAQATSGHLAGLLAGGMLVAEAAGRQRLFSLAAPERFAMLALAHSAAMLGIDGYIVRVEADSSPGTPAFAIIGLPDRALGEARERVRAAIFNCGFAYPAGRRADQPRPGRHSQRRPGVRLADRARAPGNRRTG
jgi:DNA-binding transcriptional ArsR family regulator